MANKYAGTKTEKNLWEAFAGESQARNKYTYFASVAKKAGFDWPDASGAFNKVLEETEELKEVFYSDNKDRIEDELGDLLFSVVNVARFCDCNAESALEKATAKFMRRYTEVERLAEEKNIDMKTSSIETLDKLWESVKMLED